MPLKSFGSTETKPPKSTDAKVQQTVQQMLRQAFQSVKPAPSAVVPNSRSNAGIMSRKDKADDHPSLAGSSPVVKSVLNPSAADLSPVGKPDIAALNEYLQGGPQPLGLLLITLDNPLAQRALKTMKSSPQIVSGLLGGANGSAWAVREALFGDTDRYDEKQLRTVDKLLGWFPQLPSGPLAGGGWPQQGGRVPSWMCRVGSVSDLIPPEQESRPQQQYNPCWQWWSDPEIYALCQRVGSTELQSHLGELTRTERLRYAARESGINPIVLGMVVQREWDTQGRWEWSVDWGLRFYTLGTESYGEAQITIDTAIAMFNEYPERFPLPRTMYDDGEFNREQVAWALHNDWLLNTRVAATYLADLRGTIVDDIEEMGFVISDIPIPDRATVTNEQIDRLAMGAYNQGWIEDQPGTPAYRIRYEYDSPETRLEAIKRTGMIPYVEGAWGFQEVIESELAQNYEDYRGNP